MKSKLLLLIFGFSFLGGAYSAFPLLHGHPPNLEDKSILTSQELELGETGRRDEPGPDYRLPSSLIPRHYVIRIRPMIDKDYPGVGSKNTARGNVRITVQCAESTNRVVLHQKFLTINETYIQVKNLADPDERIEVSNVEYDAARDFMILDLTTELRSPNNYDIFIPYIANVPPNDSLRGLYSESYLDPVTNETKVMAVTQLEPLRARQVFPSLDEPTYKATFDVIIGRTENFTSLANGALLSTEPDASNPGWYWDTFNTTVPMPTYLFAMAVADYGFNMASSELYRLPVRVYGPRHLTDENKAQLTANGSAMLMAHFEEKYGIAHKMPKVDSISVPYKGGAMENYGLITYGESLLMYHEGVTLDTQLRQMHHILAHELGHQWFGNLVTCKWWSDIWLNEGFATYVSFEGVQSLWPRFDMMNFMIHDTVNSALKFDATAASHPIHEEAYNAEQIGRNMDTIGYSKGGSVVRLMVSFMGEETFYKGIRAYLESLQDQVAEQNDLFAALDKAANDDELSLPKNVTEIMNTWTLQKGFPLVQVTLGESENNLAFTQTPWQNADDRNNDSVPKPSTSWDVPVRYLVQNGQDNVQEGNLWLLKSDESPENVTMQNGSGWILTNPDAGGYYRTLYDDLLADRILEQLIKNHTVFPLASRVRLLDDQLTLGYEKYVPIQKGLAFTKYLGNETDPTVWFSAFSNLLKLRMLWGPDTMPDTFNSLRMYLLPKVEKARENVDLHLKYEPSEVSAVSILYNQLVDWACALNSEWCTEYAAQLYEEWTSLPETNPVPNNLQSTIYCKMVELNDEAAYKFLLEQYHKQGQTRDQKSRLAPALGCREDTYEPLILALQKQLDSSDCVKLLQQILIHSDYGRYQTLVYLQLAKQFMIDYGWTVQEFVQVVSVGASYFGRSIDSAGVQALLWDNSDIFGTSLNATIDAIDANVEWVREHSYNITTFFYSNSD